MYHGLHMLVVSSPEDCYISWLMNGLRAQSSYSMTPCLSKLMTWSAWMNAYMYKQMYVSMCTDNQCLTCLIKISTGTNLLIIM